MSDAYRTVEEYTKLYATKNNISIEDAANSAAVGSFKEYARRRDDKLDTSRQGSTKTEG